MSRAQKREIALGYGNLAIPVFIEIHGTIIVWWFSKSRYSSQYYHY